MKLKDKIFTKKLYIFLTFVLFAAIIWFLNSLNREYITEINLPVIYENLPPHKANITELPEALIISVKANGFDILKYELKKSFSPTKLDMNSVKYHRLKAYDTSRYYILTKEFFEQIKKNISINIEIKLIKPDTIYFHFTTFMSKKVPVFLNADFYPQNQFAIKKNPYMTPDSVVVSGPKVIVDTITKIKTEYFELNSLTENTLYKAKLEEIDKVKIEPQIIDVDIEIEEYTELRFKIPVETANVPDSISIHLFPNTITVVCKVGYSNYNKIEAADFRVKADYYSIFETSGKKLMIEIVDYPQNIYGFSFSPEFVEYIIEKKE